MAALQKVDHTAIRTNQAFIIGLNLLAFLLDQPLIALTVAVVMALGNIFNRPGFSFVYKLALEPLGLVKPDVIDDNPEPHRFAQSFGSAVIFAGVAAQFSGLSVLGWGLVWLVIALAALNLFGGFCVGCAMYYWLNRLHVPGFVKSPPPGTIPGMRPKEEHS